MSTKAEDTQKNILDTARKHFLKDGLTGASLRNIVKDAGISTDYDQTMVENCIELFCKENLSE